MSFVLDRQRQLNAQLLDLFRLERIENHSAAGRIFALLRTTPASLDHPVYQRARDLQRAIECINLDTPTLPNLHSDVLRQLDKIGPAFMIQSEEVESKDITREDLKELELLFLAKCTVAVYVNVLDKLLSATLPLSEDIFYWETLRGSQFRVLYYILQTTPARVASFVSTLVHSILALSSNLPTSTAISTALQRAFSTPHSLLLPLFPKHLHRRLESRPTFSVFSMARYEVRHNRNTLVELRKMQSSCLGFLSEYGMQLAPKKGEKILQKISASIKVMKSELEHVTNVEVEPKDACYGEEHHEAIDQDVEYSSREIHSLLRELITTTLPAFEHRSNHLVSLYGRPSLFTRCWLPCIATYFVGRTIIKYAYVRRSDIVKWMVEARETLNGFIVNWVYNPMRKVWETIRHREGELGLLGPESLRSDLDSLERMVMNFARQHYHLSDAELDTIAQRVRDGDMSLVLRVYESEIKTPLKSVARGNLVEMLLIQVQKAKVDLELAMAALDKLLRANELNFAFLAVGPSLLLLYFSGSQLMRIYRKRAGLALGKVRDPMRYTLRQIERLLIQSKPGERLKFKDQGMLLCEVHLLRTLSAELPTEKRTLFLEDLRDLEKMQLEVQQRLRTVERMWTFWPFLKA
ncbi:uncharacterized protein VTP21DRAFT_8513 [Calcarisporiella thermophila]|uniref:uncharacterized protein n=1 Tax=Calcarisporiella thermophila TaxID=911321 RepID=UPI0037444A2A